jgi:hypothetical protein
VKSKTREREKPKTPESGQEKDPSKPIYDYHEGSVYDVALRLDILRGYERFKVSCCSKSARCNDNRHATSSLMDHLPQYYPR